MPVDQFLQLFFCFYVKAFLVLFFYRYSAGLTIESSSHMVLRIVNITVINKHHVTRPEFYFLCNINIITTLIRHTFVVYIGDPYIANTNTKLKKQREK